MEETPVSSRPRRSAVVDHTRSVPKTLNTPVRLPTGSITKRTNSTTNSSTPRKIIKPKSETQSNSVPSPPTPLAKAVELSIETPGGTEFIPQEVFTVTPRETSSSSTASSTNTSPTNSANSSPCASPRFAPRKKSLGQKEECEQTEAKAKTIKRRSRTLEYGSTNLPGNAGTSPPIIRGGRSRPSSLTPVSTVSFEENISQPSQVAVKPLELVREQRRTMSVNICTEDPIMFLPNNIENEKASAMTADQITELGFEFGTDETSLSEFMKTPNSRYECMFQNPLYNSEKAQDVNMEKLFSEEDTLMYNEVVLRLVEKGQDPNDYVLFANMEEEHKETVKVLSARQRSFNLKRKQSTTALLTPMIALLSRSTSTCCGETIGEPVAESIACNTLHDVSKCGLNWKMQKAGISSGRTQDEIPNWKQEWTRRRSYQRIMEEVPLSL